jgi:DNA-directed RNA polymerase subunit M/transcription elongation factor TFIIS
MTASCRSMIRRNFKSMMNEHENIRISDDDTERISRELEEGVYSQSVTFAREKHVDITFNDPKFMKIYKMFCKKISANLNPNSYVRNHEFLSNIIQNNIEPKDACSMTPQEIYPEQWQQLIDEKTKKDKHMNTPVGGRITEEFRCPKCGKHKAYMNELQTRSADEAMTIFLQCVFCSKRWKVN